MYDPEPSDNYNEWIEIYNPTNKSINISGWSIIDNSGEDFIEGNLDLGNGTTIIPPYSYAIITDQGTEIHKNYKLANNTTFLYVDDKSIGNGLGNSGDKIILKNNLNETTDFIEWIIDYDDIPGEPAIQVQENLTLSRYKSRNNSKTCFYEGSPTPGYKNKINIVGKISINADQTSFLAKRNETTEVILNIKNEGHFPDNITINISNVSKGWFVGLEKNITNLSPNSEENISLYVTPSKNKKYRYCNITITAISGIDKNESDTQILYFEQLGSDLYIKDIKIYSEDKFEKKVINQGEIIRIKAFLKNLGKENTTDMAVGFYYDHVDTSHLIGCKYYDSVGKYQKYPSILWDTVNIDPGYHTIYVVADINNSIDEFDETNNVLSCEIKIFDTSPSNIEKQVLISEFYYHNRPGVKNEYIKIFNPSSLDIDISGWYFTTNPLKSKFDQNKIIFPEKTKIDPKGFLIVTQNASAYNWETNEEADFEYVYDSDRNIPQMNRLKTFVLSNNGDAIVLKNEYNHTIDVVLYGEAEYDYNGWTGEPIHIFSEGIVLKRNINQLNYLDTNTKFDWINPRPFYIGQSDFTFENIAINGEITTFVSPDCSYKCITDEIKKASNSIYINMYEFTSMSLCDEIVKALIRNVSVNILLDGSPVGGLTLEEKYLLKRIENYGGNIRFIMSNENVHRRYSFNHAKYLVIDDEIVIVESCNFADTGIPVDSSFGNREWGIIIKNSSVAECFLNVFFDDYEIGRCDIFSYDSLNITIPHRFFMYDKNNRGWYESGFSSKNFVGNISIHPVFSPDNSYNVIIDLIEKANSSIYIEQLYIYPNWTDEINPFVELLIKKSKNGVDVKVIINYNPFYETTNDKINQTKKLFEENGIEVKYVYTNWSYFTNVHNKGMIVDNRYILISSINWNENSVTRNREAGVIIENEGIAKYYKEVFFYDWNLGPIKEEIIIKEEISPAQFDENTIYTILIFTVTFILIAQDWRKRKWT